MPQIFATLVLTSARLLDAEIRAKLALDSEPTRKWGAHVESAYEDTHAFYYNEFHARQLHIEYAGGELVPAGYYGLSPVWTDYVLLENRTLGIASLHVHIRFSDLNAELGTGSPQLTSVISFLRDALWSADSETASIPRLQRLLHDIFGGDHRRSFSLSYSRYSYVSIVRPFDRASAAASAAQTQREQGDIYRFLYLTENAIGPDLARQYNDTHRWSSEEFFALYYQPGGLVSVAEPYPAVVHNANPNWFFPHPPQEPHRPQEIIGTSSEGHSWNYNHLPEYPPLRYLAVPSLDFAASAEETLRDVHDEVMSTFSRISKLNLWQMIRHPRHIRAFFGMPQHVSRLTYRMHAAENMEAIRLPIARPLVDKLIETQIKVPTRTAIAALAQQEISTNSSMVAFIALVFGIVAVVPDLGKAALWLLTQAHSLLCWAWPHACLTSYP